MLQEMEKIKFQKYNQYSILKFLQRKVNQQPKLGLLMLKMDKEKFTKEKMIKLMLHLPWLMMILKLFVQEN